MKMIAMPVSRCRSRKQFEDLRLDGHVERGRRLVCDQDVRLAGQRHGDHHALAHAAGELMGVFAQTLRRRRDAHLFQEPERAPFYRFIGQVGLVQGEGLGELAANAVHGVQRRHRFLEDHRDAIAADLAHPRGRQVRQAFALEPDVAALDAPGGFG